VIVIYTVSLCFFIAVLHATSAVNIYNSLWRPFVICLAAYIYTIGLFFLWGLTCSQKNPPEHVCSNKSQPLLILCYHDVGSQFTPFWHVYAIIRNTFQVFFPVTDHYTLFLKIDCMDMQRLELSWTAINALVNCNHGSCSYDDGILHGESIRKLSWQGSYCLCCSNKHGTAILGSK
jgi:hypothetical protein